MWCCQVFILALCEWLHMQLPRWFIEYDLYAPQLPTQFRRSSISAQFRPASALMDPRRPKERMQWLQLPGQSVACTPCARHSSIAWVPIATRWWSNAAAGWRRTSSARIRTPISRSRASTQTASWDSSSKNRMPYQAVSKSFQFKYLPNGCLPISPFK